MFIGLRKRVLALVPTVRNFLPMIMRCLSSTDLQDDEAVTACAIKTGFSLAPKNPNDIGTSLKLATYLCALKEVSGGKFEIKTITKDRIELIGRKCPFGDRVCGHPELCMVSGRVMKALINSEYRWATLTLNKSIAKGDSECLISINLNACHLQIVRPREDCQRPDE